MTTVVVIPSVRNVDPAYLEPLGETPVVIVDDTGGTLKPLRPWHTVLGEAYRRSLPTAAGRLVPTHSPSCKGLGLLYAWREGFDTIVLLDDDCDTRVSPDFLDQIPVGRVMETSGFRSPSGWLNTMRLLTDDTFWARGYPYEYRHEEMIFLDDRQARYVAFNEGLWTGTPDINGADKLACGALAAVTTERTLRRQRVRLAGQQRLPLSIMNVQIHRDLLPAFYQPPDYVLQGGFKIRRHDDVWSAYALKLLMDKRHDVMTAGAPLIWHRKAGDPVQEVLSEHCTNLIQPWLFGALETAAVPVIADDYAVMAERLGRELMTISEALPGQWAWIGRDYGQRLAGWATLLKELST